MLPVIFYVTLRYVTLRYGTLRYVTLRYVMLCFITLYYVMVCYMPFYVVSYDMLCYMLYYVMNFKLSHRQRDPLLIHVLIIRQVYERFIMMGIQPYDTTSPLHNMLEITMLCILFQYKCLNCLSRPTTMWVLIFARLPLPVFSGC